MLSQEEYEQAFPYMRRYADIARKPPNRGFYQAPLYQGTGMMDHAGAPASNSEFYAFLSNNMNASTPYTAGLNNFLAEVTPKLHAEVQACTARTKDPIGCNIAGAQKAKEMYIARHR